MLFLLTSMVIFSVASPMLIKFPTILYVYPGDNFELSCNSEQSASIKIFAPDEHVPSVSEAAAMNTRFTESAERTTTINEYENASEEDEGIYTCLVMHGPGAEKNVSIATCQVIVVDLCGELNCQAPEECVSDYETGKANCVCPKDMCDEFIRVFEPMCTDTCETFFNECHLKETACHDKKERKKSYDGVCRTIVNPVVNQLSGQQEVNIFTGDVVPLSSGLVQDGDPLAEIIWTFTPEDGEPSVIPNTRDVLVITATDITQSGVYECAISHCAKPVIVNSYKVMISEPIVTDPPPVFTTPLIPITTTGASGPDDLTTGVYPVCTFYNNGVFELFSGSSKRLAFSCHHVMAADVYPAGNEANPWFIYGTFDVNGGESSLRAMSFYVGNQVFEIQRGWIVNIGGQKLILEEGVEKLVLESKCKIKFVDLHLVLDCPSFSAYYDGFMNGHIRLLDRQEVNQDTAGTQMGLCFGTNPGRRVNWQVGQSDGLCQLQDLPNTCTFVEPYCSTLVRDSPIMSLIKPFGQCGIGSTGGCAQLYCNNDQTAEEICAFKRADALNCNLKYVNPAGATSASLNIDGCSDGCDWKNDIIDKGCPQDSPPFDCPIDS